ncbi:MAG: tRNA lysidine(34) synthetase TilS [Heliobacteriaceae bacterium]|nr:tRNA lysidine(34) synthetase TilS [Heliobacteriaceae bacterium]
MNSEPFINKIELFLDKYRLREKRILAAFSGGWDSMCLLDVLTKLGVKPAAIHLNHNWRAEESLKEAQNCEQFCADRDIEFYTETLDSSVARTETAAREARYAFFERCAQKYRTDCILTAHNYDDNAETVLYRIIKGTGTKGLEGIKEKRGIFYRPLLGVTRGEIEEYCRRNNLKPNNDSSNNDTKYKRNLIRKEILPALRKINPDAVKSLNSLSQVASYDNCLIDEYISALKEPYKNFHERSAALKSRLIYQIFIDNEIDYDRTKINYILNFIEENKNSKSGKTCSLTKGLWILAGKKGVQVLNRHPSHKNQDCVKIGVL